MNNWSNRSASLALAALLAGCGGTPRQEAAPSAPRTALSGTASTAAAKPSVSEAQPVAEAPSVAEAPVPERAAAQYAKALQLMKAGNSADAELEFKQLALSYPDYAGPQLNLGLLYLRASRLAEAEAAFKSALARNPANPIAGNELGIVERRLGKFKEAEAAYQHAIEAEPGYAAAHLNLGVLYDLYLAEPQRALEQFERYTAIAGENKQVAGWVVELRKRAAAAAGPKKEPG